MIEEWHKTVERAIRLGIAERWEGPWGHQTPGAALKVHALKAFRPRWGDDCNNWMKLAPHLEGKSDEEILAIVAMEAMK